MLLSPHLLFELEQFLYNYTQSYGSRILLKYDLFLIDFFPPCFTPLPIVLLRVMRAVCVYTCVFMCECIYLYIYNKIHSDETSELICRDHLSLLLNRFRYNHQENPWNLQGTFAADECSFTYSCVHSPPAPAPSPPSPFPLISQRLCHIFCNMQALVHALAT